MKRKLSILMMLTLLLNLFIISPPTKTFADETDSASVYYEEIEGETTTITLSKSFKPFASQTYSNSNGISIPNYVIVSITPNKKSYSITVRNIGIDAIDSISLNAVVKKIMEHI